MGKNLFLSGLAGLVLAGATGEVLASEAPCFDSSKVREVVEKVPLEFGLSVSGSYILDDVRHELSKVYTHQTDAGRLTANISEDGGSIYLYDRRSENSSEWYALSNKGSFVPGCLDLNSPFSFGYFDESIPCREDPQERFNFLMDEIYEKIKDKN